MEHQPFSVSMCVYGKDNPQWFREAITSLLQQTLVPDEIVIVVDGPLPIELEEAVDSYEKLDLFKIIRLEKNQGHGVARRTGLENCSNELVALMDADDICVLNRFEKQIGVFDKLPVSVVGGQIAEFIETPDKPISYRMVPETDFEIKKMLKKRCSINQPAVMFKKSDVELVGGYQDWYCDEDYYLWIRMALASMQMANVGDVLVNMRINSDSYKRRGGFKYFRSERKLQRFMLKNHYICFWTYFVNVVKRFVVQVLVPNRIRARLYKRFARKTTL